MSQPPIFVSYSRHDADFALRLGRDLRAAGVNLWIDQLDIPPGGRWDREVERALKASRMLIVVLSPEAVASENVMDEVGYALSESKRVVPVMSRSCDLPLRLQRVQYVDLSANYSQGLERLVGTLGGPEAEPHISPGARRAEPRPVVTPAAAEPRAAAGWKPLVGGAVLAALVLGGAALWRGLAPRPVASPPVVPTTRDTVTPSREAAPATVVQMPDLMTRPLTELDLAGKSFQELDLMRNEIYARHGRRFMRADLQAYFDSQPWYRPVYTPEEFPMSLLSAVQRQNADFIQRHQQVDGQWLVIVGSFQKGSGADSTVAASSRARALANRLPGDLRPLVFETPSDDYPNLAPGLVVVALGPYPSMEAADHVRSTVDSVVKGPYIKQGRSPRR